MEMDKLGNNQSNNYDSTLLSPRLQKTSDSVSGSRSGSRKKPQTRLSTELFGLGPAICVDDATISGVRLPTCRKVLRCMMYHCNLAAQGERPGSLGATSRFTTAKEVLRQVKTLYEKANIPIVTELYRVCEKIVKLLDDNNKLRSIDKSRRETPAAKRKLDEMEPMLASAFQLWPPNVESLDRNAEDLAFLESMKGDRAASFGAFDKTLAKKTYRRHCRDASELQRFK